VDGAKGILFNITGGPDLGMYEIDEAAKTITEAADPDANIIFGATIDEAMAGEVKITVIATGFEDVRPTRSQPAPQQETQPASLGQASSLPRLGSLTGRFGQGLRRGTSEPAPSAQPLYQPQATTDFTPQAEEDELEVPAFIRRKLK
jgi:cell division protein FtsZ